MKVKVFFFRSRFLKANAKEKAHFVVKAKAFKKVRAEVDKIFF